MDHRQPGLLPKPRVSTVTGEWTTHATHQEMCPRVLGRGPLPAAAPGLSPRSRNCVPSLVLGSSLWETFTQRGCGVHQGPERTGVKAGGGLGRPEASPASLAFSPSWQVLSASSLSLSPSRLAFPADEPLRLPSRPVPRVSASPRSRRGNRDTQRLCCVGAVREPAARGPVGRAGKSPFPGGCEPMASWASGRGSRCPSRRWVRSPGWSEAQLYPQCPHCACAWHMVGPQFLLLNGWDVLSG